jgi:LPXTG-motif cell wall-anchored protein
MDGTCQNTAAVTKTANVVAGPGVVAGAANSASASRQCPGMPEQTQQTSQVLNLGGVAVPLPAAGCGAGTPDTRFGPLAPVATIVCNADDVSASGVRQALDVFALTTGGTSLVQDSTAQSESHSIAAAAAVVPQCSDGVDNDNDGKIDYPADRGCVSAQDDSEAGGGPQCADGVDNDKDGKIDYPADKGCTSAKDDSEAGGGPQCADGVDNDNDGKVDAADPGCHSDGNAANKASYDASDNSEAGGAAQCADGRDNDGDGLIDAADPGCHSDGNAANKASYDARDDSEANGAVAVKGGSLAFTGTDVIGLALAGLLVLAGGLLLRRREDLPIR